MGSSSGATCAHSYGQWDWGLVDYDPKPTANGAARSQWLGGLGGCLNQDEVGWE
jgi:hypothetical protein